MQLNKNRSYAIVLVTGLAIALATGWLTRACLSALTEVDRDIPDYQRIYRLENRVDAPGAPQGWLERSPMPFKDAWRDSGAPVELAARVYAVDLSIRVAADTTRRTIAFVDPEFASLFPIRTLRGDLRAALERPDSMVVSERASRELFGIDNAIGSFVSIAGAQYVVTAIVANRLEGSALSYDLIMPMQSAALPDRWRLENWSGLDCQNFVRVPSTAAVTLVLAKARERLEQSPWYRGLPPGFVRPGTTLWTPRLVRLDELRTHGAESGATRLLFLSLIAATTMLVSLAAVNFVNLSAVRVTARKAEIGIRKSVGGAPLQVALLFTTESVVIAVLAFAASVPLAFGLAVGFESFANVPVRVWIWDARAVAISLVGSLVLGLAAGAYPTWIAYRTNVAQVIAGRGSQEGHSSVNARSALTGLGFIAAIVAVAYASVVYEQSRFSSQAQVGFDARNLLFIDAPVSYSDSRLEALRAAIERLPGVTSVALSADVPGRGKSFMPIRVKDEHANSLSLGFVGVNADFFQTYSLKPIAGRVFESGRDPQGAWDTVVISRLAVRELGLQSPSHALGHHLFIGREGKPARIIGVVPDIRLRSLREELRPSVYSVGSRDVRVLSVRTQDPESVSPLIAETWRRYFPEDHLRIVPVADEIARNYWQDEQLSKLVAVAAIIALFVSACSAYALASYTMQRKTREIALRRLYGASDFQIARTIFARFIAVILISAGFAVPMAIWLAMQYLAQFAEHAPRWPSGILLAVLAIVVVVGLSIITHLVRAMRIPAVEAMKS